MLLMKSSDEKQKLDIPLLITYEKLKAIFERTFRNTCRKHEKRYRIYAFHHLIIELFNLIIKDK